MATKTLRWSRADLARLPDDGNRYEVVAGELFVTPTPSISHQRVSAAFHRRIEAFVDTHRLGWAFFAPGDVPVDEQNLVQPDLFVIPRTGAILPASWKFAAKPILVVEILSPTTVRRDLGAKRALYEREGIPEYWVVDLESREVRRVRPRQPDVVTSDRLEWRPAGTNDVLAIDLQTLFRGALDG